MEAERSSRVERCVSDATMAFNCPFADSFGSCLSMLECGVDEEPCVFEALVHAKPEGWDVSTIASCIDKTITDESVCENAIGTGPTRSCLSRYEACAAESEDGFSPFADDRCFTLGALSASAIAQGTTCLSLGCEAIDDCLSEAGAFAY
ncbi:MAG: hypothetical protein QM784_05855 [Polyangiaceae bacterium]